MLKIYNSLQSIITMNIKKKRKDVEKLIIVSNI